MFDDNTTNETDNNADIIRKDDVFTSISVILTGYVSPCLCAVGILGNLLCTITLTKRMLQKNVQHMEKSATYGLIALSVSDMLFCVTFLPQAFVKDKRFYHQKEFSLIYRTYGDALVNMFVTSGTFLTLTMAVQRYFAICHPMRTRLYMERNHTCLSVGLVSTISILFNLPRFWQYTLLYFECLPAIFGKECGLHHQHVYMRRKHVMMLNQTAKSTFIISHFILSVAIPFLLLTFCNVNLIRALHKSYKLQLRHSNRGLLTGSRNSATPESRYAENNQRVTLTLVVIIAFFLLLVVPAEVMNFIQAYGININAMTFTRAKFIIALVNTLQKVNFSFNFILYCIVNTYFRKTVKSWLTCHKPRATESHSNTKLTVKLSLKSF